MLPFYGLASYKTYYERLAKKPIHVQSYSNFQISKVPMGKIKTTHPWRREETWLIQISNCTLFAIPRRWMKYIPFTQTKISKKFCHVAYKRFLWPFVISYLIKQKFSWKHFEFNRQLKIAIRIIWAVWVFEHFVVLALKGLFFSTILVQSSVILSFFSIQ